MKLIYQSKPSKITSHPHQNPYQIKLKYLSIGLMTITHTIHSTMTLKANIIQTILLSKNSFQFN